MDPLTTVAGALATVLGTAFIWQMRSDPPLFRRLAVGLASLVALFGWTAFTYEAGLEAGLAGIPKLPMGLSQIVTWTVWPILVLVGLIVLSFIIEDRRRRRGGG